MDIQYRRIPGRRNGETVLADLVQGFIWHVTGENRYRCFRYISHTCRAVLLKNELEFRVIGTHSHRPDHEEINDLEFINWCKDEVRRSAIPLHTIFLQANDRFRGRGIHVEFHEIRRTLQRTRRVGQPPIPHNVGEADVSLRNSDRYRMTKSGATQFYWGRVSSGNDDCLVFINTENFPAFLVAEEIHMDATFRCTPAGFYQLASLHMISFGMAVNVAMFLMTRKTQQLYEAAVNRVLEVCHQQTGQRPSPTRLVSDFELAILQTMTACFPTGQSRGCWFHFGSAIYKRACSLGLETAYKENPDIKSIVRSTIALALFPSDRVMEGFEVITGKVQRIEPQLTPQIRVALAQFMAYFRSFWLEVVGPERFCVFDAARRTNNDIESWHRIVNMIMGGAHLNFWEFIENIQTIGELAVNNLAAVAAGRDVRLPRRRAYQQRDRKIARAIQDLVERRYTVAEFFTRACNFFDPEADYLNNFHLEGEHGVLGDEFEVNGEQRDIRAAFEVLIPVMIIPPEPVVQRGVRREREPEPEPEAEAEAEPQLEEQPAPRPRGRPRRAIVQPREPDNERGRGRGRARGRGRGRGRGRFGDLVVDAPLVAPLAVFAQPEVVELDIPLVVAAQPGVVQPDIPLAVVAQLGVVQHDIPLPVVDQPAVVQPPGRGRGRGRGRPRGRGRARNIQPADPDPFPQPIQYPVGQARQDYFNALVERYRRDNEERGEGEEDVAERQDNEEFDIEDPCSICLARIPDWGIDSCVHRFCRLCITRVAIDDNRCPLCRQVFIDVFYAIPE